MMMPANYSAVAENEMTYVIGGGVQVGDLIASGPISTFTSNIITIVGNSFMSSVISNTLGVWFGGYWGVKDSKYGLTNEAYVHGKDDAKETIRNTAWNNWTNELEHRALYGYEDGKTGFRGVVNAGMRIVGGLAAIAQLCVVDTAPAIGSDVWYIDGSKD